jgi:hypothetical protein
MLTGAKVSNEKQAKCVQRRLAEDIGGVLPGIGYRGEALPAADLQG